MDTIVENCLNILNSDGPVQEWNHTNIVLIPKVRQARLVSDFRPISLCNVSYKIVTKVLANRLKVILNEIIDECQSAFISGRSISEKYDFGTLNSSFS